MELNKMNAIQILKSLVQDENLIKEHKGWGPYIQVPFKEIRMIGLIDDGPAYTLSFHFGATQEQSRAFYAGDIQINHIKDKSWQLKPDFHLSNPLQNLIWFDSLLSPEDYISFWKKNTDLLYQHNRNNINNLLFTLVENGVIVYDEKKIFEFNNTVLKKNYHYFNICAGFAAIYSIDKIELEGLFKRGEVKEFFKERINEGLKIIYENGNEFFKNNALDNNFHDESEDSVEPDGF